MPSSIRCQLTAMAAYVMGCAAGDRVKDMSDYAKWDILDEKGQRFVPFQSVLSCEMSNEKNEFEPAGEEYFAKFTETREDFDFYVTIGIAAKKMGEAVKISKKILKYLNKQALTLKTPWAEYKDIFFAEYLVDQRDDSKPWSGLLKITLHLMVWWEEEEQVEYTNEFEAWWHELDEQHQQHVASSALLLDSHGTSLELPYSSPVSSSRHAHMRELRMQKGVHLRILYAFDPRKMAILLIGGDTTGDDGWYERYVPLADRLYDEHLKGISEELPMPKKFTTLLHGMSENRWALIRAEVDAMDLEMKRAGGDATYSQLATGRYA